MTHPARPIACHDTRELERQERGERFAKRLFFCLLPVCVAVLAHVARWSL